jgi:hypothetical protein
MKVPCSGCLFKHSDIRAQPTPREAHLSWNDRYQIQPVTEDQEPTIGRHGDCIRAPAMFSGMRRVFMIALPGLCGCGVESLFQSGFDPSKSPEALLSGQLPAGGHLGAFDVDASLISSADVPPNFVLSLGSARDFTNVRLTAHAGNKTYRGMAISAPRGKVPTDVGMIDSGSTAAVLLVEKRLQLDTMRIAEAPTTVIKDLITQAGATDPDLDALRAKVAALVDAGATFADNGVAVDPPDANYDALLARAAQKLRITLSCDPAFIRVMFTVDISGVAKDGNGARQLIRQPPKDGHVYIGITIDDSSPVPDAAGALRPSIVPNDLQGVMTDAGTGGDEVASDGVYTRVFTLPRGMRVKYKYTDGSAGEGFTRTEEWPGNARILEIDDVVSRYPDGRPDCLVVRRDVFGDEASNKNFVNLNRDLRSDAGTLSWDKDLGGPDKPLSLGDTRQEPPLTPVGVPEARENGVCRICPAPLTLDPDDHTPPDIVSAAFRSTREIRLTFTKALDFTSANNSANYLILNDGERALPVAGVAPSGNLVTLQVESPDFQEHYVIYLKGLTDASMAHNPLPDRTHIDVAPDTTAPRLQQGHSAAIKDLNPSAPTDDPTSGEIVVLSFDEELDQAAAEDIGNYYIVDGDGAVLPILAAYLREGTQVWLVTARQVKLRPYQVTVTGVRDVAGNYVAPADPQSVRGFALYEMTFGVVPGFAFASRDGRVRGIPRGEQLYLTGTVLAVAHDLDGNNISVGGRTDVTGVPQFQMMPSSDLYHGQPIYRMTLLAPPSVYAWKPAHGVPGEYLMPPTTLEKVEKDLATTNDADGVAIDPETSKARNGIDYSGAILSLDGTDPPGPHVIFKRENPDEVCEVTHADVACPSVIIGTWRDLDDWLANGRTDDYDDGVLSLDPLRDVVDTEPPRLLDIKVRDSESVILSFDEAVGNTPDDLMLSATDDMGMMLPLTIFRVSFPAPHQIAVQTGPMPVGASYTLTYNGLVDLLGNRQTQPLQSSFPAPPVFTPFQPWDDATPPAITQVVAVTPTEVDVTFSKAIAPATADASHFVISSRGTATAPTIAQATVQGGGRRVVLTTSPQAIAGPYMLTASNIADTASPPHLLVSQSVDFAGFGDMTPPSLVYVAAISSNEVVVRFDKSLDALSASAPASYQIQGLAVAEVEFSGRPESLAAAFNPSSTTFVRNVVVLHTSAMAPGAPYRLSAPGVHDLSGNASQGEQMFNGVGAPVTVDVEISYLVSNGATVAGQLPPRAISPQRLAAEREGVFLRGATLSLDGTMTGTLDPVTMQLGGFPPDGAPLDTPSPQLTATGTGNEYSITIRGVPLGTVIEWKALASYTVAWKDAHPNDPNAQFADARPGPSAWQDGQEYPGNENGARILGQPDGSGVIHLKNLFGDETTYKKLTNHPAFIWVVGDWAWHD